MATLKDVARLANVDVSTVSRALNNASYVHPETKARILAAVKKLSYQPNLMARGLKQGKRHTIGVVVPALHMTVFAGMIQNIDREARKHGYAILLCSSYDTPSIEKDCLNRLRNGLIDGLIIAATGRNSRLIQDLQVSGIAVVQIIREQIPQISSIVADYEAAGYGAVHYLYQLGCRHIGLINGSILLAPYHDRFCGYRRAIQELGLPEITTDGPVDSGNTFDYGYQCTQDMLFQYPELDAVMAAVDIQGIGTLRCLKEQKRRVPQDVRVISMTGHSIGSVLETTMTAMELPAAEMGRSAARMVIEDIEASPDRPSAARRMVFSASLVEREST